MKIRMTQPISGNKYYNNKKHNGLSDAVDGYPMISGLTVLDNCVGWANSRFNEIINDPDLKGVILPFHYQLVCNAENFIESAKKQGLSISSTPIQGGIMVWQKGKTLGGGDGAGHVAVVEEVYEDGSILTSESGWASWTFKTVRRTNSNGRWGQNSAYKFRGCIINPSVKDPKVVPAPKLTVDGIGGANTVRALQRFLGTPEDGVISGQSRSLIKTYCPSLTAVEYATGGSVCVRYLQKWLGIPQDGIWGRDTSVALQKKLGVTADGIFAVGSMSALQMYLNNHEKAVYPTQSNKSSTQSNATQNKTNAQKIVEKAKEYAWPYGTAESKYDYKKGSAKEAYKTALKKQMGKSAKISQSDCGYFVSTCVRAVLGNGFTALPASYKKAYPAVPSDMEIVHTGAIGNFKLQPGDIIRFRRASSQHVEMYYGDGLIAEANREHCFPHIEKSHAWTADSVKKNTIQVIRAK